jgi:hypothetical protein
MSSNTLNNAPQHNTVGLALRNSLKKVAQTTPPVGAEAAKKVVKMEGLKNFVKGTAVTAAGLTAAKTSFDKIRAKRHQPPHPQVTQA